MKRILLIVLVLLVPLGVFGLWPIEEPTTAKVQHTFTIDVPLWETYLRLAPPDTVRKIVVLGNSKFISEKSEEEPNDGPFGLGIVGQLGMAQRLLRNEDIVRHSILTVETNDDYVGQQIIQLQQDAVITRTGINSHTELLEAQGRLLAYECTSTISGEERHTTVQAELLMTIRTRAPRLFRWIPKRRVHAAAELRLSLLEEAFREVIEKPLLPGDTAPEKAEASLRRQVPHFADWRRRRFAA